MTGGAVLGRRFVEKDSLGGDDPSQLVTLRAAHILVCSAQGKGGPFLVIEQRGLPPGSVVTIRTASNFSCRELLSVNVLMTVFALGRGRLKINVGDLGLEIRRLMAVDAGGRTMSTEQSKLRLGMVKPGEFLP